MIHHCVKEGRKCPIESWWMHRKLSGAETSASYSPSLAIDVQNVRESNNTTLLWAPVAQSPGTLPSLTTSNISKKKHFKRQNKKNKQITPPAIAWRRSFELDQQSVYEGADVLLSVVLQLIIRDQWVNRLCHDEVRQLVSEWDVKRCQEI